MTTMEKIRDIYCIIEACEVGVAVQTCIEKYGDTIPPDKMRNCIMTHLETEVDEWIEEWKARLDD